MSTVPPSPSPTPAPATDEIDARHNTVAGRADELHYSPTPAPDTRPAKLQEGSLPGSTAALPSEGACSGGRDRGDALSLEDETAGVAPGSSALSRNRHATASPIATAGQVSASRPSQGTTPAPECIHCGNPLSEHHRFARCDGGETQFTAPTPSTPSTGPTDDQTLAYAKDVERTLPFAATVGRALVASRAASRSELERVRADWRWEHDQRNAALEQVREARASLSRARQLKTLDEWHEDDGPALWWAFHPHTGKPYEQPWVGTPLDSDWEGYHTHWTSLAFANELRIDRAGRGSQEGKSDG